MSQPRLEPASSSPTKKIKLRKLPREWLGPHDNSNNNNNDLELEPDLEDVSITPRSPPESHNPRLIDTPRSTSSNINKWETIIGTTPRDSPEHSNIINNNYRNMLKCPFSLSSSSPASGIPRKSSYNSNQIPPKYQPRFPSRSPPNLNVPVHNSSYTSSSSRIPTNSYNHNHSSNHPSETNNNSTNDNNKINNKKTSRQSQHDLSSTLDEEQEGVNGNKWVKQAVLKAFTQTSFEDIAVGKHKFYKNHPSSPYTDTRRIMWIIFLRLCVLMCNFGVAFEVLLMKFLPTSLLPSPNATKMPTSQFIFIATFVIIPSILFLSSVTFLRHSNVSSNETSQTLRNPNWSIFACIAQIAWTLSHAELIGFFASRFLLSTTNVGLLSSQATQKYVMALSSMFELGLAFVPLRSVYAVFTMLWYITWQVSAIWIFETSSQIGEGLGGASGAWWKGLVIVSAGYVLVVIVSIVHLLLHFFLVKRSREKSERSVIGQPDVQLQQQLEKYRKATDEDEDEGKDDDGGGDDDNRDEIQKQKVAKFVIADKGEEAV